MEWRTEKLEGAVKVVCLCGSTRFKDQMMEQAREETLNGNVVIMPHVFAHAGDVISEKQKMELDTLHLMKVVMADEVLVIDVNEYVGDSTRREIDYALKAGKHIRYFSLEEEARRLGDRR